MEDALAAHADIARRLVTLFEHRFNPTPAKGTSLDVVAELQAIDHRLGEVESLDEDRILRLFVSAIAATVRSGAGS